MYVAVIPYGANAMLPATTIDKAIDRFKTELQTKGEARLPDDRKTLLRFYEQLYLRQIRRREKRFYATGSEDLIANWVLAMIDGEIAG